MGSMRIGTRLALSFAVLLGLLFAVAMVSLQRLNGLAAVTQSIVEVQANRAFLAQEASQHAQSAANCLLKLLLTTDRERRVKLYAEMDAELAASDAAVEAIAKTVQSADDAAQLKRLNVLRANYDDRFRETVELIEMNGPLRPRDHFDAYTKTALDDLLQASLALAAGQRQQMRSDLEHLQHAEAGAKTIVILLALGALLAGAMLAWFMTRTIVGPVGVAVGVAEAIADGNLHKAVPEGKRDEVGKLLRALRLMRDSIVSREDKILRLAYEDALTGLPNRTRFVEAFGEMPAGRSGAVVVLGIDRFALINNALGHAVGDRLLREIGQRLQHLADGPPQRVARLWGDEFAFLLEGADRAGATAFAEATAELLLRTPVTLDGQRLDVSGTLGIALYPQDGSDVAALLRRAALAMRAAKKKRSRYALVADLGTDPPHEHLSLIGEMREALARGEFVVHYQPKLDLAQNRVTGAEALVRWLHPRKGLILPAGFIPFAEQTGFIREITPWLLGQVIAQAADWHRAGRSVIPSVNLSTRDLLDPGLVGYVGALLDRHALPPDRLCLEITESALMEEPELALTHLNGLSALGLKLSIDDYGTGQAALAYLKTLPVNELKIDRAFVNGVSVTPKNGAIARSTIVLCHELGLSVVAEGAETAEEIDWLRANGCDVVQGYGIAKPMPLAVFLDWLSVGQYGRAANQ